MSETSGTEVQSSSSEILRIEHYRELKELKSLITTLQQYVTEERRPSDGVLRNLQESGEKLLVVLEDSSHAALYCANFIVTMMKILPKSTTYFKGSRIRKVLQALIDNVQYIDSSETGLAVELLWKSIVEVGLSLRFVEYSSNRFTCMFPHLLSNSFSYLRNATSSVLFNLMNAIGVKCLLNLAQFPTNKATHESLSIILMQLVRPSSEQSKLLAQGVLKTCGYHITDAIIKLLNPVLVKGDSEESDHSICHFVYSAIYELLTIDKDLVIGLINNTELCLSTGRTDRCIGIEFLARLFSGNNIPGMPNPSLFFSTLWRSFSAHCKSLYLTTKAEVMLIARYSTHFLVYQPDLAVIWCSVLRIRLLNTRDPGCISELTQSIANYFLYDFPSTHAGKSMAVDTLVKDLLRISGPNELQPRYRILFVKQLASVYEKLIDDGLSFSNLEKASAVLENIYFVCELFDPLNEDWYLLRHVFINHLVPWDLDCNERVKRFLLLFTIIGPEHHHILHQLFYRTSMVRKIVRQFLVESKKELWEFITFKLCTYLVHCHTSPIPIFKRIVKVTCQNSTVRALLTKCVKDDVTCTTSKEACDDLKQLLVTEGNQESEIIDSFLFYIAEPTLDVSFFQVLVREVDSYITVDGYSFSNPKSALLALAELLYIRPELGFTIEFVNQLKGWIEIAHDGVLIRQMLECFKRMGLHSQLELWNPLYTQRELIPFWLQIVESGRREETKLAIECLAVHLKNSSDAVFMKVLKILDNQLKNASDLELYEHGLSALGHVAKVCSSLTEAVRDRMDTIAISRVLENIYTQEDHWTMPTSCDPECQWMSWRELNIGIRLQVQSLRTIGRCMRHAGKTDAAVAFLKSMEFALRSDVPPDPYSKVDWNWIRLESASAALNIWERKDVGVTKELFIKLSCLLTDDNFMMRKLFAEKLRRGLTPVKAWVDERGKSKGSLPSTALGLLALLGLNDERELDQNLDLSYKEDILIDVFQSFRNQILLYGCSVKGPGKFSRICTEVPHFLPEYALVHAVPVLAEYLVLDLSQNEPHTFDSFELGEDAIVEAWKCLSFLSQSLGKFTKGVPAASKTFLVEMAKKARDTIKPTANEVKFKVWLTLYDLLLLVAEHHSHSAWGRDRIHPQVKLPQRLFSSDPLEDQRCEVGSLISGNMVTKLLSNHTIRVNIGSDSELESTCTSSDYEIEESEGEEELLENNSSTSTTLSWDLLRQRNSIGSVRGKNHLETISGTSASSTFNSTLPSPNVLLQGHATSTPNTTRREPSTSFQGKRKLAPDPDDKVFKTPLSTFKKK